MTKHILNGPSTVCSVVMDGCPHPEISSNATTLQARGVSALTGISLALLNLAMPQINCTKRIERKGKNAMGIRLSSFHA